MTTDQRHELIWSQMKIRYTPAEDVEYNRLMALANASPIYGNDYKKYSQQAVNISRQVQARAYREAEANLDKYPHIYDAHNV